MKPKEAYGYYIMILKDMLDLKVVYDKKNFNINF